MFAIKLLIGFNAAYCWWQDKNICQGYNISAWMKYVQAEFLPFVIFHYKNQALVNQALVNQLVQICTKMMLMTYNHGLLENPHFKYIKLSHMFCNRNTTVKHCAPHSTLSLTTVSLGQKQSKKKILQKNVCDKTHCMHLQVTAETDSSKKIYILSPKYHCCMYTITKHKHTIILLPQHFIIGT